MGRRRGTWTIPRARRTRAWAGGMMWARWSPPAATTTARACSRIASWATGRCRRSALWPSSSAREVIAAKSKPRSRLVVHAAPEHRLGPPAALLEGGREAAQVPQAVEREVLDLEAADARGAG